MKQIWSFFVSIGIVVLLSGCNADGKFALRSKMTGQFATAVATTSTEKNGRYTIDIDIRTQGLYNLLRGKRHEHYRSTGRIRKGLYYSYKLTIERWTDAKHLHSINAYTLDYKHRKITRHYREWHGKKKVEESRVTMDYFAHDDFLTVLHNAWLDNHHKKTTRKTYYVAASEETHGKVPVFFTRDPKFIKRWGAPKGGAILQMGIHKGIFKNGKGSMTVLLDAQHRPVKFYLSNLETINTLIGVPIR